MSHNSTVRKRNHLSDTTRQHANLLITRRIQKQQLENTFCRYRHHVQYVDKQLKCQQVTIHTRYYNLHGYKSLPAEVSEVEKKIQALDFPRQQPLGMTSSYIREKDAENQGARQPDLPKLNKGDAESVVRDLKQKRQPYSSIGKISSLGELVIDDFSRKLYPWETVAGFEWLQSLGSPLNHQSVLPSSVPAMGKFNKGISASDGHAESEVIAACNDEPDSPLTQYTGAPSTCAEIPPLSASDIAPLMSHYAGLREHFMKRNKLLQEKMNIITRYNPLYLDQNLIKLRQATVKAKVSRTKKHR